MDMVLVEITDKRAYRFLQGLEELNVIKLIEKKDDEGTEETESPTAKFRGALNLTEEQYNNLQRHVKETRNEWERDI